MSTTSQTFLSRPPIASEVPSHVAEQVELRDGSQAIEVSALFEDAVQEVRHFDNPAGGQVSGLTKGLLGSAGASLAGVFLLFSSSYVQVAKDKEQSERGELAAAASTHRGSRAADYGAAGLLSFGTGALLYGLWRRSGERKENEFSIGTAAQATFQTSADGLPSERFPLVRSTGTEYELLFTGAMSGEVTVDGKTSSLQDWATAGKARPSATVPGALATAIPRGARFSLQQGHSTFLVSSVARPRQYPVPMQLDWQQQSYTGAVLAGAGLFLGLMFSVPAEPRSLAFDSFLNEHLTKITSVPPVPPDEKAPWLKVEKATPERNSSSRAHSGPSGKVGSEQAPKAPRQMQNKGPKDNPDPKLAAALAADAARNTGILGMLSGTRSSALAAVLTSDSGLGRDAADALGNLVANEVGDAYGDSHALGFVGTQRGGNGPLDGPIGLGNILGPGGDPRTRRSPPRIPALAKHTTVIPDVSIGPPAVVGMDKDLIRRVIRSHMNEVKFCYESELTRNNKLEGRVQVQFIIGTTGTVTNSIVQSSTLGNRTAESCIANAVRRWDFPRPQSGVASVSYPFVLKTAGE